MPQHKLGARAEFRQQQRLLILDSSSLAAKFPKLKSLKADLQYFPPDGLTRSAQIKYSVDLDHAKAIFRFDCLNRECIRGDFDLSKQLAKAVAGRRTIETGEIRCPGWRNKDSIETVSCRNILRYKLTLGY